MTPVLPPKQPSEADTDLARLTGAEEQIAHLQLMTDELSQVVADQQDRIARLETRVEMLMRREAGRESDQGGSIPLGDERPPHW
ncbi:hypothetical protein BV394_12010 [Brevirhabdus pacifica]|uniref:Uncharacterized protein n=1 Tax=Brevirhabdus pacifica TaxID=1267768 RepID=A0A1U7DK58_9RHOB|nr:SlyX family protein [Brevirhabdus pacifica]APX90362.1 hypothetical protein BV394_12010 [Brevirhabdus pacifica]PJJ80819.1 SlyX protein [Brevirhabdus pacifica]